MFILSLEIRAENVEQCYAALQKVGGMHPPVSPKGMDYELKIYPVKDEREGAKAEEKIN